MIDEANEWLYMESVAETNAISEPSEATIFCPICQIHELVTHYGQIVCFKCNIRQVFHSIGWFSLFLIKKLN